MTQSKIIEMLESEWRDRLKAAVLEEREACAKLCEKWTPTDADGVCDVADAIRERL